MTAQILNFRDYQPKFREKPPHGTTAQIVYFCDYQQPKDLARMYGETTMEQQAIGILDYVNGLVGVPYGGAGIDGMDVTQANAFHAPEKDPRA